LIPAAKKGNLGKGGEKEKDERSTLVDGAVEQAAGSRSKDMFMSSSGSSSTSALHKENLNTGNTLKRPAVAQSPIQAIARPLNTQLIRTPTATLATAAEDTQKDLGTKRKRGDTYSQAASTCTTSVAQKAKNQKMEWAADDGDLFGFGPDEPVQKNTRMSGRKEAIISQNEEEEDIFGFQSDQSEQQKTVKKEVNLNSARVGGKPVAAPVTESTANSSLLSATNNSHCKPSWRTNISTNLDTTGFIGKVLYLLFLVVYTYIFIIQLCY
jgi:hypothetical protein